MKIDIEVDTSMVGKKFDDFIKGLEFGEPLGKSAELLKKEAEENFDRQGALYQGGGFVRSSGSRATTRGKAWAPLAKATREQRRREGVGPARPILMRKRGRLRHFHTKVLANKGEVEITSKVSFAKYHQSGGKFLPQRKLLGTTDKSRRGVALLFSNYIAELIKKFNR